MFCHWQEIKMWGEHVHKILPRRSEWIRTWQTQWKLIECQFCGGLGVQEERIHCKWHGLSPSKAQQSTGISSTQLIFVLYVAQHWNPGLVLALSALGAQEKGILANLSGRWRQRLKVSLQALECIQLGMLTHVWNFSTWEFSGNLGRSNIHKLPSLGHIVNSRPV